MKNTSFIHGFSKCRLQSIMLILFITLMNHTSSWAQPNLFAPVGKDGKVSTTIDPVTGEIKSDNIILNSGNEAIDYSGNKNSDYEQYRNFINDENELNNYIATSNLKVNYDSLYEHYLYQNKSYYNGAVKFHSYIIPYKALEKIARIDTSLYKMIVPTNLIYATLTIKEDDNLSNLADRLSQIENASSGVKLTTSDIINHVLPPIILLDKQKITPYDYQKKIDLMFTLNPRLVYYCDKSFIRRMQLGQFQKLLNFHLNSDNIIDMRQKIKTKQ